MTKRWKVQQARDWWYLEIYLNQLSMTGWTIHQVASDNPPSYVILAYKEIP